ncbi:MAG: aldolase/citrate lyase family protein [Bauldia sp.]
MTRLNSIVGVLESGGTAFATFAQADPESAQWLADSSYDGVVFEMEHRPWDAGRLRDALQYMLSRRQIAAAASIAARVTPIVRVPANGGEMNQWLAKQALDSGVYGVVWPHVATAEQAYNAVSACRYPRRRTAPLYEPAGKRGDWPPAAARYWGVDLQEYYRKADVWPLAPEGEILVVLMIEDLAGVANLDEMLMRVPGIGAILIGEGDLSQEIGHPRDYRHPDVVAAVAEIVRICNAHRVPVGHPHVNAGNVQAVLAQGYRLLLAAPVRSFAALEAGRALAGRT